MSARLAWCKRWRALVCRNADTLVALARAETHKPEHEALAADVMSLLAACKWHERYAASILRDRRLLGRPIWMLGQSHIQHRAPLGSVAIIATWNYPIQLVGVQVLQALLTGNRVTVKPSERSPQTQGYLLKLARLAGASEELLAWTDASREAGPVLLSSQRFDHVVFTGSTAVGRQVAAWAAQSLTPTTLELSGQDSALVLHDADPVLAARTIWQAATMNSGQTCMSPRRAIVSAPVYNAFLDALSSLAAGAKPVQLIDASAAEHCRSLIRGAIKSGARSLSGTDEWSAFKRHGPATTCGPTIDRTALESRSTKGDNTARESRATEGNAAFIVPAAIVDCDPSLALVEGAHFGPILAVVPARDDEHALAIHDGLEQNLAVSVFTRDTRRATALAPRLRASIVTINDAVLPSGHPAGALVGRGPSGWGASRGIDGLLAMTRPVCISRTHPRFRIPAQPPDAPTLQMLRRLSNWLYLPFASRAELVEPDAVNASDSVHAPHATEKTHSMSSLRSTSPTVNAAGSAPHTAANGTMSPSDLHLDLHSPQPLDQDSRS